jgi:formylglycine-generating enzyme required for sulfatase activity
VPGGNYLMGCVPGDTECEENEKPLVMATLSPFFIEKEEATFEEIIPWLNEVKNGEGFSEYLCALWKTDGTMSDIFWGAGWSVENDPENIECPVILDGAQYVFNETAEDECPAQGGIDAAAGGFSWLAAKMYCEWKGMQLPTEAQWEAAARGQTTNIWPCGSDLSECWEGVYACCYESETCYDVYSSRCHCCAPFDVDEAYTCVSPFGVKGMYGNANEWTADYESSDHSECADGCVDPQFGEAPFPNAVHILKGGDMYSLSQSWLRISARKALNSDDGSSQTGVRCVRPDTPFVPPDAGMDGGK